MAHGQRNRPGFNRHNRRGNSAIAVGAAVAAFSLVAVALLFVWDSPTELNPPSDFNTADAPVKPNTPQAELLPVPAKPMPALVAKQPAVAQNTNAQPVAPVVKTLTPAERVAAHAEAGEFGLALDVAQTIADVRQRAVLYRVVADAQMNAGEFDGAMHAIGRIPVPELQGDARGEKANKEALAGGGSLADFTQLIDLIQQETSGPWVAIDGTGGSISSYDTGVRVDPNGLLGMLTQEEHQGRLDDLGIKARRADLNENMAQKSSLRVVSLTRLEAEISRRMQQGEPVLTTMKHLAGLSSVRYVFVDPSSGEIMIAGPAEGWTYNDKGIPVGINTERPTLQLDDLVTVMRIFSDRGDQFFNCLIVPRQDGLKKLSEFVNRSNARGALRPGAGVRNFANKCQDELGLQDTVFNGVPTDSRVARVILEADYRMKLIGIDKLDAGPNIPSYFDLLTPQAIQQNPPKLDALRWWMTMKYDAVLHSPSRTVFEIKGPSVQCQSENELIKQNGERIHTGQADPTNQQFAQNFTRHYGELANRDVVFADLKNIFDLSLVAALLHREQLAVNAETGQGVFAADGQYHPAKFAPAQTVMSVVNHKVYNVIKSKGISLPKDVIVQVAGGVRADLAAVLRDENIYKVSARLESLKTQAPQLPEGRWWWDAK